MAARCPCTGTTRAPEFMFPQKSFVLSSPRGEAMKVLVKKMAGKGKVLIALALLLLSTAAPAAAQKQEPKTETSTDAKTILAAPDTQAIDLAVGESLGYWQIGDVESLRKYYADDVVVVTGDWTPPLIGWDSYAKAYQAQRARVAGGRMDRTNTLIKVNGSSAWAR